PGADLLDGLVAGERAEGGDPGAGVLVVLADHLPEALGAAAGEGVLLADGAGEGEDVLSAVVAADPRPARVDLPVAGELLGGHGRVPGAGGAARGGGGRGGHRRLLGLLRRPVGLPSSTNFVEWSHSCRSRAPSEGPIRKNFRHISALQKLSVSLWSA